MAARRARRAPPSLPAAPTIIGRKFPLLQVREVAHVMNLIAGTRIWTTKALRRRLAATCAAWKMVGGTTRGASWVTSLDALAARAPAFFHALILAAPPEEIARVFGANRALRIQAKIHERGMEHTPPALRPKKAPSAPKG